MAKTLGIGDRRAVLEAFDRPSGPSKTPSTQTQTLPDRRLAQAVVGSEAQKTQALWRCPAVSEALPDAVREKIESGIKDAGERALCYELLCEFGYVPKTRYEIDKFIENIPLLRTSAFKEFYRYLRANFGYDFELSSVLNDGIRTSDAKVMDEYSYGPIEEVYQRAMADIFDAPGLKRRFEELKQKFTGVKLSVEGLIRLKKMDAESYERLIQTADTLEDIEKETGAYYAGNELTLLICKFEHPERYERFTNFSRGLSARRPSNVLTEGVLRHFDTDIPPRLKDFWNWLESGFTGFPISIEYIDTVERALGSIKDWSPDIEANIRKTARLLGVTIEPQNVFLQIDHLAWTSMEIEACERISAVFPFERPEKADADYIDSTRKIVKLLLDGGHVDSLAKKEHAHLFERHLQKMTKNDPLVLLAELFKAENGIKALRKIDGRFFGVTERLSKSGVDVSQTFVFSHDPLKEVGGYAEVLQVLRHFVEETGSLADWERSCSNIKLTDVQILDLREHWIDLSNEQRKALLDEKLCRTAQTVRDKIGIPVGLEDVVWLSKLEKKEMDILQSEQFHRFFKENGAHILPDGPCIDRIETAIWMYEMQAKHPKYMTWVRNLSFAKWMVPYDLANQGPEVLNALERNELPALFGLCKELWIKAPRDLGDVAKLLPILDVLKDGGFKEFRRIMGRFNNEQLAGGADEVGLLFENLVPWELTPAQAEQMCRIYRDSCLCAFIMSDKTSEFYRRIKPFKFYIMDEDVGDMYQQAWRLYDYFNTPDILETAYRVADAIGIEREDIPDRMNEYSPAFEALSLRGFDFFDDLRALMGSGEISHLFAPGMRAVIARYKKDFGYKPKFSDMSSLITISKSARLKKAIMSGELRPAMEFIRSRSNDLNRDGFSFHYLDDLLDISAHQGEVRAIVDMLGRQFNYKGIKMGEVSFISDLIGRRAIFDALASDEMKSLHERLRREAKYEFGLEDVYVLIYLLEHRDAASAIFDPEMEKASVALLGEALDTLEKKARFHEICRDRAMISALGSGEFKSIRQRVRSELNREFSMDDVQAYIQLMEHPEAIDFLRENEVVFYSVKNMFQLSSSVQSVATMRALGADEYLRRFEASQDGKGEDRVRLIPSVADGKAWEVLAEKFPDIGDFIRNAEEISRKYGKKELTVNDIYCAVVFGKEAILDRASLVRMLAPVFNDDVHRLDNNFDSYSSYNDLDRFDVLQLNKMARIRQWLASQETRNSIGAFIHRDVVEYPASELGMQIALEPDNSVTHREYPPRLHFNNGSYSAPPEAELDDPVSLASVHLHALKFDNGNYAGPSGSRFRMGADITVANFTETDSAVITSLSDSEFCVHFYDANGDVAFLGRFSYNHS